MFVRWAYTPSPCLPVDTTKVGKTAAAGCGLVSARANLCALVRTQADFMQTSGSGKTQKRERKSIQKNETTANRPMVQQLELLGRTIERQLGVLSAIGRTLDLIEQKEYPPDTTPDKLLEYLQSLNRQLTRCRENFNDKDEWQKKLTSAKSPTVFYYRRRLPPQEEQRYQHTGQKEMKLFDTAMENLEKIFSAKKILSERLCIELRKMLKEVEGQLKENDKLVDKERKEKERQKKLIEEELLRAKRNAAW